MIVGVKKGAEMSDHGRRTAYSRRQAVLHDINNACIPLAHENRRLTPPLPLHAETGSVANA